MFEPFGPEEFDTPRKAHLRKKVEHLKEFERKLKEQLTLENVEWVGKQIVYTAFRIKKAERKLALE